MKPIIPILITRGTRSRVGLATALLALSMAFGGCKDKTEPAPETGRDYYPIAVGNFWVYAVADSSWSVASGQGSQVVPSVLTVKNYQFRETITETATDAAGQTTYRMLRAKRLTVNDVWRDDSVFVLTANPQFVAINRNNTRTLELIFPVKEGRSWNLNAFNNNFNDTITAETRQFSQLGQPFTTGGTGGVAAVTFPTTLTTFNTGAAAESNVLRRISYQQVFGRGIGPVFRRRLHLVFYTYTLPSGLQVYVPGSYAPGFSRRETLLDFGPR